MAKKSRASRNPNKTPRRPEKDKPEKDKKKTTTPKKKSNTTKSTTKRIPATVGAKTTTRSGDKVEVIQEVVKTKTIKDTSRPIPYKTRTKAERQAEKNKQVRQSPLYQEELAKKKELEREILSLKQQNRTTSRGAIRGENVAFTSQTPSSSVSQAEIKTLTEEVKKTNEKLKSLERKEKPKEEPKEKPKSELQQTRDTILQEGIKKKLAQRDEIQRQKQLEEQQKRKQEKERIEQSRLRVATRTLRRDTTAFQQGTIFTQTQDTREQEEKRLRKQKQEQEEAKSTIDRILKEANEKVKEKEKQATKIQSAIRQRQARNERLIRQQEQDRLIIERQLNQKQQRINQQQQRTQERLRRVDAGLADKATKIQSAFRGRQARKTTKPSQTRFVVGGEGGIEVPFSSEEELLQAYRNRPNQPRPLPPIQRPLFLDNADSVKKITEKQDKERQQKQKEEKEEEVRPAEGIIRPPTPQQVISEFDKRNRAKSVFGDEAREQLLIRNIEETQSDIEKTIQQIIRQSHQQAQQEQTTSNRRDDVREALRKGGIGIKKQEIPQPDEDTDDEFEDVNEIEPDESILQQPPQEKPPLVQETIRQFVDEAPPIPQDRPITQLELDTKDVIRRQSHQQAQQQQTTSNRQSDEKEKEEIERQRKELEQNRGKIFREIQEDKAATKLQSAIRGQEGRKEFERKKKSKEVASNIFSNVLKKQKDEKQQEDKAATKLQSAIRARQARSSFRTQQEGFNELQALVRGQEGRKAFEGQKKSIEKGIKIKEGKEKAKQKREEEEEFKLALQTEEEQKLEKVNVEYEKTNFEKKIQDTKRKESLEVLQTEKLITFFTRSTQNLLKNKKFKKLADGGIIEKELERLNIPQFQKSKIKTFMTSNNEYYKLEKKSEKLKKKLDKL
jgi:hypothetical protein